MLKKLGLALFALVAAAGIAVGAGSFGLWPIVGGASYCGSTGNNGVCTSTIAAGPTTLSGLETIPMDTNAPQGIQPQSVLLPSSLLAGAIGNTTVFSTTGTTAAVAMSDLVANFIYSGAGVATFTSFKLPPNPANGARACLSNSGTGILTLTAVAAGTNNAGNTPTITGTAPTSIPVMTAVGTAGTVTLGQDCWLYVAGASNNGVWYRVQ